MRTKLKGTSHLLLWIPALLLTAACASMGTPTGGPRDEEPPHFVRSNPAPGATNVRRNHISLEFNELVNVKDAFQNVVVSPTGSSTPRVQSLGRRVEVVFPDTLEPNTTYTIDFANSIQDNNENNPLQNFSYTFSTGADIDTLRISGMVLDSYTLEPQQKMLVGVHSVTADSAFRTLRLERVAKTDDRGRFSIRGLKPGSYSVFALGDINNDFRWDNPDEQMAFLDFRVSPTAEVMESTDTIYNPLTAQPDTVVKVMRTQFFPNDILLSSFNVNYKPQYLLSNARTDSTRLSLIFNAPSAKMPELRLLSPGYKGEEPWITERSRHNDTITLWLRPMELIKSDTIRLQARYNRNKAMGVWEEATDTLEFITKRPKGKGARVFKNRKEKNKDADITFLKIVKSGQSIQEVNQPRYIEFDTPLDTILPGAVRLETRRDTVWHTLPDARLVRADSLNPRLYVIKNRWAYGATYRLKVDSLGIYGIYGHFNKPFENEFKVRKEDEYATLTLSLTQLPDSMPAFVELLNTSDKPVRTATVADGRAVFDFLLPGTYYARVIEDANGNGIYDTGNYDLRLQPETVHYYPKRLLVKKNWDVEETWNVDELPVDRQKPEKIKKNKPDTGKNRNRTETTEEEEEDDYFDPTANPFDPNSKKKRRNNINGSNRY